MNNHTVARQVATYITSWVYREQGCVPYKSAAHILLISFGQILACCIQVTHIHIQADVCCPYAENLGARKTNLCLPAYMLHACTHIQHICASCRCAALTAAHMQHVYCSHRFCKGLPVKIPYPITHVRMSLYAGLNAMKLYNHNNATQ